VEDDPRQNLLSQKALGALSDNVQTAKTKDQALNIIKTRPELDLLVCRAANNNSKESGKIIEMFFKKFPNSRVLVITERPEVATKLIKDNFAVGEFLSYPYTLSSLIIKADNVLKSLKMPTRSRA